MLRSGHLQWLLHRLDQAVVQSTRWSHALEMSLWLKWSHDTRKSDSENLRSTGKFIPTINWRDQANQWLCAETLFTKRWRHEVMSICWLRLCWLYSKRRINNLYRAYNVFEMWPKLVRYNSTTFQDDRYFEYNSQQSQTSSKNLAVSRVWHLYWKVWGMLICIMFKMWTWVLLAML